MGKKGGRPVIEFDRRMIDTAKEILGPAVFPGKAASRIAEKLKIGRDTAYKLIEVAQHEVVRGLQEQGSAGDPATAIALFLTATMANTKYGVGSRIDAANGLTRLLGLGRQANAAGLAPSDVEKFLGELANRVAAAKAGRLSEPVAETTDEPASE